MFKKEKVQVQTTQTTDEPVCTIQVVPFVTVSKDEYKHLEGCNMYDIADYDKGIIKENCGVVKKPLSNLLVFDVTDLPEDKKAIFGDRVRDFHVKKGLKRTVSSKGISAEKILSVLPLDGVYSQLSDSDLQKLGRKFLRISEENDGVKIDPVTFLNRGEKGDIVLRLPSFLGDDLSDKVAPEIREYVLKENGLYEEKGSESMDMETGKGSL